MSHIPPEFHNEYRNQPMLDVHMFIASDVRRVQRHQVSSTWEFANGFVTRIGGNDGEVVNFYGESTHGSLRFAQIYGLRTALYMISELSQVGASNTEMFGQWPGTFRVNAYLCILDPTFWHDPVPRSPQYQRILEDIQLLLNEMGDSVKLSFEFSTPESLGYGRALELVNYAFEEKSRMSFSEYFCYTCGDEGDSWMDFIDHLKMDHLNRNVALESSRYMRATTRDYDRRF